MSSFYGISFWWALILMLVFSFVFGLRALISWRRVQQDAREDYDYKSENGMIPHAINREEYESIYRRVYFPRGPVHAAVGMGLILLATPVAMLAFEHGFNLLYNLSGQNRVIEPGYLVWQFFLFFGMIAVWVGIGYLVSRRYHQTTPGSLQYEIDQHVYGDPDFGDPL